MKLFPFLIAVIFSWSASAGQLVIYADNSPEVIAAMSQLADKYKADTGTEVVFLPARVGEIPLRLQADADSLAAGLDVSTADLLVVKDIVFLNTLVQGNWFQPMKSALVEQKVLPSMRDPQGLWTALSFRARTLVYDTELDPAEIAAVNTYEDLAKPEFEGYLCLRSSTAEYTQALTASLIAKNGPEKTAEILTGWLANRTDPDKMYMNDEEIIVAIYNGDCRMGITNSYYLGKALKLNDFLPVGIKFLNKEQGGVHVNGVIAGVSRLSKQAAEAQKFIEFLFSDESQALLAEVNQYYPASQTAAVSPILKAWPDQPVWDVMNWNEIMPHIQEGQELLKQVDYK